MALIALAVVPVPVASRNLEPMMLAVQFTPTTPRALLPTAPTVPETCEPWLLSSAGLQVLVIALKPCEPAGQVMERPPMLTEKVAGADQAFALRSGCVESMPGSTTVTTLAREPVKTPQAELALMSAPAVPESP